MAEIIPLRGLIYDPRKVKDLGSVMAPPYDVISPARQDELYSRHRNNIVRIDFGKSFPDDAPGNDRYSRAASELCLWIDDGVLRPDESPAIYYYTQTYNAGEGRIVTRKGFMALVRLEEFGKGGVHPHERTLSGPKADRLRLMEACGANLSPIFSLYSDQGRDINRTLDGVVNNTAPLIDVKDDDGVVNRLWRVADPDIIRGVAAAMSDKALFIADGHHRYETALKYRDMMRARRKGGAGPEPCDYVLMYFSNMDDEGMTIWPTHRVIHGIRGFDPSRFLEGCREHFDIEERGYVAGNEPRSRDEFIKRLKAAGGEKTAIGLHLEGVSAYHLLTLKSRAVMDKAFGDSIPEVFKGLDVTVLHSLILAKMLGITQEAQERQENIVYVKSWSEALDARVPGRQAVFLLNPTKIGQVKAVALAGHVMPQKSTYFYPKLLTGLVINHFAAQSIEGGERAGASLSEA